MTQSNPSDFPAVSPELIEALLERYPDKMPRTVLSLEEFNFRRGQVSVIDFLKATLKDQRNVKD